MSTETKEKGKHTPGPWRVDKYNRVVARREGFKDTPHHPEFVVANNVYISGAQEEQEANARLIAAAPELLEMLKAAYNMVSHEGGGRPPNWDRVRAAIALAEHD